MKPKRFFKLVQATINSDRCKTVIMSEKCAKANTFHNRNEPFFKESFEALLSKFCPKSEKGQSFGKRFSGLSLRNNFKLLQFVNQYLNSICSKFRCDWTSRSYEMVCFSSKSCSKRFYRSFESNQQQKMHS